MTKRAGTAGHPAYRARGGGTLHQVMPESESLAIEWRSIRKVRPYDQNPRVITDEAVDQVATSIKAYGWRQPIVIDEQGVVIAGHTRLKAAKKLKLKAVPVHVAIGMSAAEAQAYRIADNKTGELSRWDDTLLAAELGSLGRLDFDLGLTGFSGDELSKLGDFTLPGSEEPEHEDKGKLLDLVDITIDEPKHQVERGDHYRLHGKHHLLCVGVMDDWPKWISLLTEGAIFCPYPGPFVAYGKKADEHELILVQPDRYTAGHILDRFAEVHGKRAIKKVAP
jgi:hypothetical protein